MASLTCFGNTPQVRINLAKSGSISEPPIDPSLIEIGSVSTEGTTEGTKASDSFLILLRDVSGLVDANRLPSWSCGIEAI
jgi:hypothetical protein